MSEGIEYRVYCLEDGKMFDVCGDSDTEAEARELARKHEATDENITHRIFKVTTRRVS